MSGANIIQLVQLCDLPLDLHTSNLEYDINTGLLRLTLNDGTEFDAVINTIGSSISTDLGNQIVTSTDGIYVGGKVFALNGEDVVYDDIVLITSVDESIDITTQKIGETTLIDLSLSYQATPLTIVPNTEFNYDTEMQVLNLPLPTFSNPTPQVYTFETNDGSGTSFTITTHNALTITNGGPFAFIANSQTLILPIPSLTDNLDNTFTFNHGDGTADIIIDTSNPYDNTATNLVAVTMQLAIDELATIDTPFAIELGTQGTVSNTLSLTDNIYRTGAIGIGLTSADAIAGKLHVNGDIMYDNSVITMAFGASKMFVSDAIERSAYEQYRMSTDTRQVFSVDSYGNLSTDDVPDDMFGAANALLLVSNNNSGVPHIPSNVNNVAVFALLI